MKRFLWFNLEKLKNDADYFLITNLFLVITQLAFYFPLSKSFDIKDLIGGGIFSIFHICILFFKKEFKYSDVWNCF